LWLACGHFLGYTPLDVVWKYRELVTTFFEFITGNRQHHADEEESAGVRRT